MVLLSGDGVQISIHALRKESDAHVLGAHRRQCISIHALRKESDRLTLTLDQTVQKFQSTLSVRRATSPVADHSAEDLISIHALRKESDRRTSSVSSRRSNFNPRSP